MDDIIYEVIDLLVFLFRVLGLLVFGVGLSWFTLKAFNESEAWQVKMAVVFAFASLFAMAFRFQSAGAIGAFGLGAGIGLLLFGLRKPGGDEEEEVEKKKK